MICFNRGVKFLKLRGIPPCPLIHSFRIDLVHPFHLLSDFLCPAFPTIGRMAVALRRHRRRCHQFRTISGDGGSEDSLVHLTGHSASRMCHRLVRHNSEHCAHASTQSLRGPQSHNGRLYRRSGWVTGPHRPIMSACHYPACRATRWGGTRMSSWNVWAAKFLGRDPFWQGAKKGPANDERASERLLDLKKKKKMEQLALLLLATRHIHQQQLLMKVEALSPKIWILLRSNLSSAAR